MAVLKQKPHEPITFIGTVVILFALNHGYLDQIPLQQIAKFKDGLALYFNTHQVKLGSEIEKTGELTPLIEEQLTQALDEFSQVWMEEKGASQ